MNDIGSTIEKVDDQLAVDIYYFMIEFAENHGAVLPNIRDLSTHFNECPNMIYRKMQKLVDAGLVHQPRGKYTQYGIVGARIVFDVVLPPRVYTEYAITAGNTSNR